MHCDLKIELNPDETERFANCLAAAPAASYRQRLIWPKIDNISRLQHYRYLICEENGNLLLAAVVKFSQLFPRRYLATIFRGPVFCDLSVLQRCVSRVKNTLREAGAVTLAVSPLWFDADADAVQAILAASGFKKAPRYADLSYRYTGIIGLDRPEEEIFAGLKSRCRRHIHRAERQGLKIRPAKDGSDVRRFEILFEKFSSQKTYEVVGLPDLIDQWRYVQAEGGVFDLAEVDGRLIGGLVVFREGQRAVLHTLASLPILPKLPRSYNLLWEAIRKLKAQGINEFDLGGFSDGVMVGDEPDGRDHFKLAFNSKFARVVPLHYAALRPLGHALLFQGRQLYRSSKLPRLVGPLLRPRRNSK